MIAIVPSVDSVTQGLTTTSFDVAAELAPPTSNDAGMPSVTPNVNPAAPTMKRRRPLSICVAPFFMG
jgi:hypothetical protein